MAALPQIIANFGTILIQLGLLFAAVFKTMQMNTNTLLVKSYQFIKKIKIATMYNGVGNIERYYMNVFFQWLQYIFIKKQQFLFFFLPVQFLTGLYTILLQKRI